MADDIFRLGVQAARDGDYEIAQSYFIQVVKTNPNSEKGWLYLGHCISDHSKREYCYQKVLKLNPSNQEAQKALTAFHLQGQTVASKDSNHNPPLVAQSVPAPTSFDGKKVIKAKKRSAKLIVLMSVFVGLALCTGVFVFEFLTGFAGQMFLNIPESMTPFPIATETLTVTPPPKPSITPTRTPRSTFTPFPTASPVPTFSLDGFTGSDPINSSDLNYWDQVISQDPKNADAYYQRATIYNSRSQTGSLDTYNSKLDLAILDIDKAISLRPDNGDYYALRQSIYYQRASNEQFEVDREYLNRIALENAYKAYHLGTTIEYPERIIVIDLIATSQCEIALTELQKLMDKTPKDQSSYGGLLHIQSTAYACLGKLEDALKSVNASMFNNKNTEYKNELKAQYLIQLERYDDALSVINETFACCGYLGGYRNYWRAEIYYKMGKMDLVQEDLDNGMRNTWGRGGMLPYVEAQIALGEGRKKDAIQLLQLAEATFDPNFNTLRWRIQKQLAELGAKPLNPTPSVPYQATPIP